MAIFDRGLVILVLLVLGVFGLAGWHFHEETSGEKVLATVDECHTHHGLHSTSTTCTGSWVAGGDLLAGGHVVIGTINGAGKGDIGDTVTVHVHGDSAYTQSHATTYALAGLGVGLLALGGYAWRKRVAAARAALG